MKGRTSTFHRWMALFLSLVMCMSLLPAGTVFAAEDVAAATEPEGFVEAVMPEEPETVIVVPAEEPVVEAAPVEEPAAPVEEPAAPVEEPAVPVEEPAVPVEEPAAPVEEPAVPTEEPAVPTEEPAAPAEEADPAEEPEEEVEETEGEETSKVSAQTANYSNMVYVTNIVKNGNGLKVTWDPEPEVIYYQIWRKLLTAPGWTKLRVVPVNAYMTEASYTDPMNMNNNEQEYVYYVQSVANAYGTGGDTAMEPMNSVGSITTSSPPTPGVPYASCVYYFCNTPVQNKPVCTDNGIQISWSNVSIYAAYSTYVVERAKAPDDPLSPSSYSVVNTNALTTNSYVDTNVVSGETYYYKVRVMNTTRTQYMCEDPINTYFSIDPRYTQISYFGKASVIPADKQGVENTYNSTTHENVIKVRWKLVPGVNDYKLERMDASMTGEWKDIGGGLTVGVEAKIDTAYDPTGKTLVFEDKDIASGKIYYYRVKNLLADKETVIGSWDANGVAIAYFATPYLDNAQADEYYEVSQTGITLYWAPVPGITKYQILRRDDPPSGSWKRLTDKAGNVVTVTITAGQPLCSYTDEYVAAGASYWYTVVCRNDANNMDVSPYNDQGILAKFTEMPILKEAVVDAGGIKVIWQQVRNVDKYRVFRRAIGSTTWEQLPGGVGDVTQTYDPSNPTKTVECVDPYPMSHPGVEFVYTVRCVDDFALNTYLSSYSRTGVSATWFAKPSMKEDPAKSVPGGIQVVWQEVEGAEFYMIYRKTNPTAVWDPIAVVDKNVNGIYNDVSLVNGQETLTVNADYYYAVAVVKPISSTGDLKSDYQVCSELGETTIAAKYYPVPKLLTLESGEDNLKLTWEMVGDAVTANDYRIYRKEAQTGDFKEIYPNPNPGGALIVVDTVKGTASWEDKSVKSGNKYWYTVAVFNGTDDKSGKDEVGMAKTFFGVAGFDGIKKLEAVDRGIKVTFAVVDGIPYYQVMRMEASGMWTKIGQPILWSTANSEGFIVYNDITAVTGGKYNYTVMLLDTDQTEVGLMKTFPAIDGSNPSYPLGYFQYFETPALKAAAIGEKVTKTDVTYPDTSKYGFVELSWKDVDGATHYNIYRKLPTAKEWGDPIATIPVGSLPDPAKPTWKDNGVVGGLVSGTQYSYTVCVADMLGVAQSGKNNTGVSTVFLNTPEVKETESGNYGITVKWNAVTGATGYEIMRKIDDPSAEYERVATANGYLTKSYLDRTAMSGISYRYTVRAVRSMVKGGYLYQDADTKTGTFLATPVLDKVENYSNGGLTGINLTWKPNPGTVTFEIQRRDDSVRNYGWDNPSAPTGTYADFTEPGTATTHLDLLSYSTTPQKYSYRIRSVAGDGSKTAWSVTKTMTFYPPVKFATPAAVSNLYGTQLSWEKMTGIYTYRIYRDNGDGKGYQPIGMTAGFTYIDRDSAFNPISGVKCRYQIVGMSGLTEVTPRDDMAVAPYMAENVYVAAPTLYNATVTQKVSTTSVDVMFYEPKIQAPLTMADYYYQVYVKNLSAPYGDPRRDWHTIGGVSAPTVTATNGVWSVNSGDLSSEIITSISGSTMTMLQFTVQAQIPLLGGSSMDPSTSLYVVGRTAIVYEAAPTAVTVTGDTLTTNAWTGLSTRTVTWTGFAGAARYAVYKWDRHGSITDPDAYALVGYASNYLGQGRWVDYPSYVNAVYSGDVIRVSAAYGVGSAGGWSDPITLS